MIPLDPEQQFTVENIVMDYLPPGRDEGTDEAILQVPEFQREWSWKHKRGLVRMRKLIDSIIKNYPIPPIILNKCGRGMRATYMIFDGRHRIETLWRFYNNEFAIENSGSEFYFRDLPQFIQRRFLHRRITAIVTDNADNSKLADIFIRLNGGKPLNDNDMFWAQKDTTIVSLAMAIVTEFHRDFLEVFDYNFRDKTSLRKMFKHICGLVIGLANNDATKMSTAYAVNSSNLEFEGEITREQGEANLRTGLRVVFDLFRSAFRDWRDDITKSQKRKFLSLGTLIPFFFKEYTDNSDKEAIIRKWREIIVYILRHKNGIELLRTSGAQNLNASKITKTLERVNNWWQGNDVLGVIPRFGTTIASNEDTSSDDDYDEDP